MIEQQQNSDEQDIATLTGKFNRAVDKARRVLFLERAVPRILPPLYTSGLFLSASWAGLWLPLPPAARVAGVLAFGAALIASPFLAKTKSLLVSKDDALRHLDQIIGDPSRPAQILGDRPSLNSKAEAKALWNLHLRRTFEKWGDQFDAGKPDYRIAARDRFYLRYAVPAALAVSALLAGGEHGYRVREAFNWASQPEAAAVTAPLRLKAWVTPPDYIDATPLTMTESTRDHTAGGEKMVAHKNSVLSILVFGRTAKITVNGVEMPLRKTVAPAGSKGEPVNYHYEVPLSAEKTIIAIEGGPTWNITVTPDQAPSAVLDSVKPNDKDSTILDVRCSASDDYGLIEGEVVMRAPGAPAVGAVPLPSGKLPSVALPSPCISQ